MKFISHSQRRVKERVHDNGLVIPLFHLFFPGVCDITLVFSQVEKNSREVVIDNFDFYVSGNLGRKGKKQNPSGKEKK